MTDDEILNRWASNGNHTPLSGTYMVSRNVLLDLIGAARAYIPQPAARYVAGANG